jgi:hypothetical protein
MKYVVLALLLLCSCSPNSSEEFQREGQARCRSLVLELQKIENREQLLRLEPVLKNHFESLISLMIEAREFQQKKLDDLSTEIAYEENTVETALEEELRRIYAIEGAREVIEHAQHEALVRLDAYERTLAKKNEQLRVYR